MSLRSPRPQSVLPLARGGAHRFVPWIIAPMACLATLALALAMALAALVGHWETGLAGTLTAQLPPPVEAPAEAPQRAVRTDAALALLRATPGVRQATVLDDSDIARLLAPWLGEELLQAGLPLPTLIDIGLEPGAAVDLAALGDRLRAAVPGATVDDHAAWLADLRSLAGALLAAALAILPLIALAAAATVVFVIRAELAIHRPTILLLHQLGATDAYVARQFERHALAFGAAGGGGGLALGLVTLLGVTAAAGGQDAAPLPGLALHPLQWLALLLVPAGTAGLAVLTARLTVLRTLARLP